MKMIDVLSLRFWVNFYLSKYVFIADEMYKCKQDTYMCIYILSAKSEESDFTKIAILINVHNALYIRKEYLGMYIGWCSSNFQFNLNELH